MGSFGIHAAVFVRVVSKGVTGYVTWKSLWHAENKGFANALLAGKCLMGRETVVGGGCAPHGWRKSEEGADCKRVVKFRDAKECGRA